MTGKCPTPSWTRRWAGCGPREWRRSWASTARLSQAAGGTLRCAMVSSHQTFGEFGMWHPHWHSIVLEYSFDRHDHFFFIPLGASKALSEIWRCKVVAPFLQKGLLNPDFARRLLDWEHSGFSIETGTRVRAPLSLERIRWDEQQNTVTWSSSPSGYFKGRLRRYSSLDFIAQVTPHIPPRGKHLVRRYGLYSSRGCGTWKNRPALRSRAPANWYGRRASADPALADVPKDQEVGALSRRKAWARLPAKVYEWSASRSHGGSPHEVAFRHPRSPRRPKDPPVLIKTRVTPSWEEASFPN
jgi:hypothetical protein